MSAQEEIFQSDESAASDSSAENDAGYSVNVTGNKAVKVDGKAEGKKPKKKFGAAVVITGLLVIIMFLMLAVPSFAMDHIATITIEQTNQDYAAWVEGNALVVQQAMLEGYLPANKEMRFGDEGVIVGYMENGVFVEGRESPERKIPLCLKMDDEIITAENFYYEVNHNVKLHGIFIKVIYGHAGAYYTPAAEKAFDGVTTRNNHSSDKTLDETMDELMGSGNKISNDDRSWYLERNCYEVETDTEGTNGDKLVSIECGDWEVVEDKTSEYGSSGSADDYITNTVMLNMSTNTDQSIYNTADSLKDADTLAKKKTSTGLYVGVAESISKVKAGYGYNNKSDTDLVLSAVASLGSVYGESNINEVMNWMFESRTSTVIDVETGQPKEVKGSVLEAPSMYAILSGEKLDVGQVANYSSDRVLKTVENQLKVDNIGDTMDSTVVSTDKKSNGVISRYTIGNDSDRTRDVTPNGTSLNAVANSMPYPSSAGTQIVKNEGLYDDNIGVTKDTIQSSMYDNSFEDIGGIVGGQLLAQGAVETSALIANAYGGAHGDENITLSYMKLTSDILAMDAAADRLNRNPLDITSKNTFLGSIVYKLGVASIKSGSLLNKMSTLSRTAMSSVASLMPVAKADEENGNNMYLSNFGDCETIDRTGAKGSAQCVAINVFDTSSYDNKNGMIFAEGSSFMEWLPENIECDNDNNCTVKKGSALAEYLTGKTNSTTPLGMINGAMLDMVEVTEDGSCRLKDEEKSDSFFKKSLNFLRNLLGLSEKAATGLNECQKSFASGARFVASKDNEWWEKYGKYVQLYILFSNTGEANEMFDGETGAYNFKWFGKTNAIAKFLDELNQDTIAVND